MGRHAIFVRAVFLLFILLLLPFSTYARSHKYRGALPVAIQPLGEKVIIVDPNIHLWGAYNEDGYLVKSGMATAGAGYCPDIHRGCRTKSGSFRIYSLGSAGCKSRKFPVPRGGAPMPYCMFFNGGQALHGSYQVVAANVSHGCVRLRVQDAKWIRFNFAEEPNSNNEFQGTRVIVRPY